MLELKWQMHCVRAATSSAVTFDSPHMFLYFHMIDTQLPTDSLYVHSLRAFNYKFYT